MSLINKGVIAELYAELELIKSQPNNQASSLYYWQREKKGSQAEVMLLGRFYEVTDLGSNRVLEIL